MLISATCVNYYPYVSKKKTQVVKLIASNLPSVRMYAAPKMKLNFPGYMI